LDIMQQPAAILVLPVLYTIVHNFTVSAILEDTGHCQIWVLQILEDPGKYWLYQYCRYLKILENTGHTSIVDTGRIGTKLPIVLVYCFFCPVCVSFMKGRTMYRETGRNETREGRKVKRFTEVSVYILFIYWRCAYCLELVFGQISQLLNLANFCEKSWHTPLRYMVCAAIANVSYSFQHRSLKLCWIFVHIMKMCISQNDTRQEIWYVGPTGSVEYSCTIFCLSSYVLYMNFCNVKIFCMVL
jgi:hypothetical protein